MKRKYIFSRFFCAALFFCVMAGGCTKRFESINTDPYGLDENSLKGDFALYGAPFNQMQLGVHLFAPEWQYQLQQNLNADIYSGYLMTPTPFANNVNNSNYFMVDGWNNFIWTIAYDNVMSPAQAVIDRAKKEKYANFEAWAMVLKVLAMHRVSDIFGPVVYTNFGKINADGSVTYDSQQEAYTAFFKDLDDAQAKLKAYADDADAAQIFKNFDLSYGGSYTKWMKLINSLRLRLAIRIVKADAAKAKTEAEKALSNSYGVIESSENDFIINSKTLNNPLSVISDSWGDIRMGAPIESYLTGYSDPRLSKYFVAATDPAVAGQYKGIRNGIDLPNNQLYRKFSTLAPLGTKMPMLTSGEVWFLKAEAKLRGWAVPGVATVQEAYEKGIQQSLAQWGVESQFDTYKNSTAQPAQYVDPFNAANSVLTGSPYLSTVSPKWNDAGSTEQKLEQIITQKWIALFPESQEAWSEFRRTGYPKLFPVVVNNSGGVIPAGQFIKRINFAISEKETNQIGYQGAVQKLGGTDNIGTRLWWDKP
ncbi:SusD/RagB family nutrient-binding outer membrane lipoprotein [Pseudoflavitalea sp. X16]|uniref:RagB/SusD family nutrient uptake outer membrane protein n=1 Tax=Paraflavitalea devenefica TaxID=2716334 RepID=UPI0014247B72|nr:RagB/SusD family nutrient uptake outer membrane protein [Paraflavitalea devenefica]NII26694.1 SusD/RagB family nutrient-binding outer membrane lipoprotein [Paraflavitalea devenefica]